MNYEEKDFLTEILSRADAETSLYAFTQQAWCEIEGDFNFVPSWYLRDMCEHLEALHRGDIKDLIIAIPPRTTKSTICSVMFPAWAWLKTPGERFLCFSHSEDLAIEQAIRHRDVIASEWYKLRWGDRYELKSDQNQKTKFANTKGGYRISKGVNSKATGRGATILIADDMNNARESDVERENTNLIWSTSLSSRMNDASRDRRLITAQRTGPNDLIDFLLNGKGAKSWTYMMLPMEFEQKRRCETIVLPSTAPNKWKDPRTVEGEVLCPIRFNKIALDRLKEGFKSDYLIATQLQLNPTIPDGGLFKKSHFQWWKQDKPPKVVKIIASFDTAFKKEGSEEQNKNRSYSVCTVWGVFRDEFGISNIILLNMWRDRVEYPELRKAAQKIAANYRYNGTDMEVIPGKYVPDVILIESKATGDPLRQDLKRAGVSTVGFDPSPYGGKIRRASLITHIVEAGRVWLPASGPNYTKLLPFAKKFVDACAAFPQDPASKDIVDTFSQVLLKEIKNQELHHPSDPVEKKSKRKKDHKDDNIYGVDKFN